MKKLLYLISFLTVSFASAQDYKEVINSYLNGNRSQLELQPQDINDFALDRQSFSESMNLDNVYVIQRYQGIEVFNSNSSIAIKNNTVVNASLSFISNLSEKVNATSPSITALSAIAKAVQAFGIQNPTGLELIETITENSFMFSKGAISLENIPVKLVVQQTEENTLKLAWDLSIYILDASHYYSVRVDALTGVILDSEDWVLSCNFGELPNTHTQHTNDNAKSMLFSQDEPMMNVNAAGGTQYRVFPFPLESPNHGSDALVSDPANTTASPFGWHDTDGVAGAEFTITRGNNVFAKDDIDGNNSGGVSPDGGAGLNFDFPYNVNTAPRHVLDAATVNLFYWNNIMHDVWYQYGFNEASGNFQENNYGNGGSGSDSVNAEAQDGLAINNANFSIVPDGVNGRMQMFIWTPSGALEQPLTINGGALAGSYTAAPASFGAPLPVVPLTADLVLVEDNNAGASTDLNDACDPITNGVSLTGKIVVIRRGECEFGFKVLAAENQGAVAVIIVNNVAATPIFMAPGDDGPNTNIPSVMVSQVDGEAIIAELTGGGTINATLVETPPFFIDGDLDNGIVAHEYGHGISTRLTGGANNPGCLSNAEQMGEGWSDWFGLMLTIEPGDTGVDARGIGTYVQGQPVTGGGIRPRPYSTDFAVNELTYADLAALASDPFPHATGHLFATVLWDLSWALIDEYGFDPDVYTGTGGNNIAMQLVIDGLKLQPCSPGFVDGRNAILEADELANAGANRCLIWGVFARRGLGDGADQGSSNVRGDETISFDIPTGPNCTLGTDERSFNNNFIIHPNPSNGNIYIKSVIDVGDVTVSIFDMNGRKVFNKDVTLQDTVNVNAQNLSAGVYVLSIDGNNYSHTTKLIIK